MARKKVTIKAKEPVKLRIKKLNGGNGSLYLDIINEGKRTYEFLKIYLIPETSIAARIQNENAMNAANAIKARRIMEIANNKAGISNSRIRSKISLLRLMELFNEHAKVTGQGKDYLDRINCLTTSLKKFRGDISKIPLKDIDISFCTEYIRYLKTANNKYGKPYSKDTIRGYFNTFRTVLYYAVRNEMIPQNPIMKIDPMDKIKREESRREFLTIEELKKLIKTPYKDDMLRRAFLFSCFCGLRLGDIYNLQWNDIKKDGEKYFVSIVMHKTRRRLVLPLSIKAIKWVPGRERWEKDSDKVFKLLTKQYISVHVKKYMKSAGINKNISFHCARHTFATMMLTIGVDIYTVSKLLGHTNISTTQIYAKLIDRKKEDAVHLIDGIF